MQSCRAGEEEEEQALRRPKGCRPPAARAPGGAAAQQPAQEDGRERTCACAGEPPPRMPRRSEASRETGGGDRVGHQACGPWLNGPVLGFSFIWAFKREVLKNTFKKSASTSFKLFAWLSSIRKSEFQLSKPSNLTILHGSTLGTREVDH